MLTDIKRLAMIGTMLAIAAATSAQDTDYFPDGTFGEPRVHDQVEQWYARHLGAMREPSLSALRGRDRDVVRFLRLPTEGHPVAIRIERTTRGVSLTRRELSGSGGYDPGTMISDRTIALRTEDWNAIERAMNDASYWQAPVRANLGHDGEQWIVEAVDGDRYKVVDRWSPDQSPEQAAFVRLCQAIERLAAGRVR